jgi:cytochrome c553
LNVKEIALVLAMAAFATSIAPRSATAQTDDSKMAYGKHLSQECTACHRLDGSGTGIPSIVGLHHDYFVTTLKFYKTGARDNPAMNSVAQMLNDEQMEALAAYFEHQKPAVKAAASRKK